MDTNHMFKMGMFCFKTAWIQYVQKFDLRKKNIWKPDGKRAHVRLKRRWEDNVKVNLKEIKCKNVNLIVKKYKKYLKS